MKKIINVIGARPNYIKIAPIHAAMKDKIKSVIVHTGQHYGKEMSDIFFKELNLPQPDYYLGVGSNTHAKQTAEIMEKFEDILLKENPDAVLVVGDVNSTLACSLTAVKLGIKIIHVEAGLRSFDNTMPEEINRKLTDVISDYLFVTEPSGVKNLLNEGISKEKIFLVGNVMIDSLIKNIDLAKKSDILKKLALKDYILLTLHRPENVDNKKNLQIILDTLKSIQKKMTIVFPIHPRTQKMLEKFGLNDYFNSMKNIISLPPLGYMDFLRLTTSAKLILTDSGGIQEETTYLKIPCITIRKSTERPITTEIGTNTLLSIKQDDIASVVNSIIEKNDIGGKIPKFWDGKTAERIIDILMQKL